MWWGSGSGWGGWVLMTLMMVGFWTAVVLLVTWLVRSGRPDAGTPGPRRSEALAILEERFARGEIDREEFEDRRRASAAR